MNKLSTRTNRIDVDTSKITKGSIITAAELDGLYKRSGSTAEYGLWLLAFREFVERECSAVGSPVVLRQKDGNLHVCADNEASEYLGKRFEAQLAGAVHVRNKMEWVDESKLDSDEQKTHSRRKYVMDAQVDVLDRERVKLGMREASKILADQLHGDKIEFEALPSSGR